MLSSDIHFFFYDILVKPDTLERPKTKKELMESLYLSVYTCNKAVHRLFPLRKLYIDAFINFTTHDNFVISMQSPFKSGFNELKSKPFFPQKLELVGDKTEHNNTYLLPIGPKEVYEEIMNSRLTSFQYCLSLPDCRWLMNIGDDAYVHVPRLQGFLEELESQYDPMIEPVIKGSCMMVKGNHSYLQGGSGYILSRKALELVLDSIYVKRLDLTLPDDAMITNLFTLAGINLDDAASGRFIGVNPDIRNVDNWEDELPNCTAPWESTCGTFYYRLDKVVVFHPFRESIASKLLRMVYARPNVYFHANWYYTFCCKM